MSRCLECRHSGTTTTDDGLPLMECHRYPPQIMWRTDEHEAIQSYPTVREDDWCSEYQPAIDR